MVQQDYTANRTLGCDSCKLTQLQVYPLHFRAGRHLHLSHESRFCSFDISAQPGPDETNSLGVKGVGEAGTVGSLAVVMNAVNNALESIGAKHLEVPLTPPRVWRAVREASAQATE